MRKWKRSLYEWSGEYAPPSACTSAAPSRTGSACGGALLSFNDENSADGPTTAASTKSTTTATTFVLDNPDQMASLLGHFDFNTRAATLQGGDESTLKANARDAAADDRGAPTDFSALSAA